MAGEREKEREGADREREGEGDNVMYLLVAFEMVNHFLNLILVTYHQALFSSLLNMHISMNSFQFDLIIYN